MTYFVTGATGFIGRYLVQELLDNREGEVFVLVREGSRGRMERLVRQWGHPDRVTLVTGDLAEAALGVDPAWVKEHEGKIDHFFHLAAIYDMTASDEQNETLNVGGTRNALELAADLDAGCFHQVSSIAASGDHDGFWDETMFDVGQHLPSPYHRTKFESEKIVREESAVPFRIYRPAMVIGHSETGAMDKVDGPYYFFPLLKALRDALPSWTPLVGVDLGDTNVVPVDYVAKAMDHLAHLEGRDGEAFHLVNPEPQRTVDVVNLFAEAAKAPQFATPIDRAVTGKVPTRLLPRAVRPGNLVKAALRTPPAQLALRETIGRLGLPPAVVEHAGFPTVYGARLTQQALAGSGISVPDLESYAATIWNFWEEQLDTSLARDKEVVETLTGKTVVITGASSGIGMVTAFKVAQAGGIPVLVARGKDKLEATKDAIESRGGKAYVFPCDLSDLEAIDHLAHRLSTELDSVDYLVNNAGRSIRRSVKLSQDRFHDFERTMQLNYFGAIRLIMGLLPTMTKQHRGHVVNISSIGVQTSPPRFSAYVASKAALDAWSNVVSSEVVGHGVTFTNIHMPLVKTPMIAPTKIYDKFPTISPAQAADMVIRGLVDRPHEINTTLGTAGALAHTLAPRTAFRVLNLAYKVFPDSAAARGDGGKSEPDVTTQQQLLLARLTKGVHW
ncbi:SDR family oxidoreductase [Nocardioides marmoribigeumensis]|uniref:NAD(P)-dependent dehydrogenase (Short-subunit alcohol dehydrogenase family) n=1 Tax=Nocardioides marmoribigeumensis TaxID=433649 RepID=A0ABU2BSB4_9ACTN|nr:SDR family oxidoreductase [Nocardioides marmoribigeumensis]MDR7361161.1 NAD(P)-dependent dehydrogenase (short-subunit alcohol dehydrogenase family) [Nocardioides marmoribigeumensis]